MVMGGGFFEGYESFAAMEQWTLMTVRKRQQINCSALLKQEHGINTTTVFLPFKSETISGVNHFVIDNGTELARSNVKMPTLKRGASGLTRLRKDEKKFS